VISLTRNWSFSARLMAMVVLSAGGALAMVTAVTVWREATQAVEAATVHLDAHGRTLSVMASASVAFEDRTNAQTLLDTANVPLIAAAAIYDKRGQVFASNGPAGMLQASNATDGAGSSAFLSRYIRTVLPVRLDDETIGKVQVVADMRDVYTEILVDSGTTLLLAMLGIAAAVVLAGRLQRSLSAPIVDLCQTMDTVTQRRDYSIRATKHGENELGRLTDGFNSMLKQIQSRDTELAHARDRLEEQVAQRTEDLRQTTDAAITAAESLKAHQAILRATIQSTCDGILVVSSDRRVLHVNKLFCQIWQLDENTTLSTDERETLAQASLQMRDPEAFIREIEGIYASDDETSQTVELLDGRVLDLFSAPLLADEGISGRIWSCRDITKQRTAEIDREQLHRQLMDSSRRIGMAEVAANVLHNVGNVLNSVNVSTGLIDDRLRNSRLGSLKRTAELLDDHRADLVGFLTADERGRHLPDYLCKLADHLSGEQTALIQEVESLVQSVEHIKQIVTMQQSYAKVGGILEKVDLRDMIRDALRLNQAALDRHGITVREEFDRDVPALSADKHQLLQVLVNLISNAKYAMSASDRQERILTLRLRVQSCDAPQLVTEVIDNGKGIAADDLTRIFSHGYTTRTDGHGFGLHSAALAAHDMGGSLTAHSDGPGQGARFTLELPIHPDTPTPTPIDPNSTELTSPPAPTTKV
jgi:signal transduction histidine kinase/uncharacterized membrane protein affecting hemolysin expression